MVSQPRSDGYYAAQESWLQGELADEDFKMVTDEQFGRAGLIQAPPELTLDGGYDDKVGKIWRLQGAGKLEEAKQQIALHGLKHYFPEVQ